MTLADTSSPNPLLIRLHELERETDVEFVGELIDIYLQETPKQIQAIAAALTSQNMHELMISAHTLKGSSLNIGANQFGSLCHKLEEIGRSSKSVPENTDIADIKKEYEQVKSMLLAFKQNKHS